ncbi:hypothetical protein [Streptomyces sp. SAI-25]|uniref:hypothetical protein n=1 Tax=Streptomyces sp. SAI-25 TaxID=1472664 RepID=UPI00403A3DF5
MVGTAAGRGGEAENADPGMLPQCVEGVVERGGFGDLQFLEGLPGMEPVQDERLPARHRQMGDTGVGRDPAAGPPRGSAV